jgi:hypothetical protein
MFVHLFLKQVHCININITTKNAAKRPKQEVKAGTGLAYKFLQDTLQNTKRSITDAIMYCPFFYLVIHLGYDFKSVRYICHVLFLKMTA